MIRSNRLIILSLIFAMVTVLFGCDLSHEKLSEDILLDMYDATTNSTIVDIYAEDILNVKTFTFSREIIIDNYDFDLNEDGFIDKIVTVRSPLHSGSHGDTLDFLIGNDDGTYRRISGLTIQLYAQSAEHQDASMYILRNKTNGFHDVLIKNSFVRGDQVIFLLKYQNGQYELSRH